jgi:alpha-N-arabinofuranosidase
VLAVANKSPDKAIALDIEAVNKISGKTATEFPATILSGSSPDDFNDIGAENRVVPEAKTLNADSGKITIPAHSVVFVTL